jgi:hypothetical protein
MNLGLRLPAGKAGSHVRGFDSRRGYKSVYKVHKVLKVIKLFEFQLQTGLLQQ